MEQYTYPNNVRSRRISRRRRRMRRALAFGGIVLFLAIAVVGFQGWKIVSAIVEAEKSVVVPLPTRSAGVELGGAASSNDNMPAITPESMLSPTVNPDGQAVVVDPTPTEQVVVPSVESTIPVINVTVVVTPTAQAMNSPTPESTPAATATATVSESSDIASPEVVTLTPTPVAPSLTATPTDSDATVASPEASPEPAATIDSDGTGGPETTPAAAPVSTPEPEPTITTPISTPTPEPTQTVEAAASPSVSGATVSGAESDDGELSRLDIVRQVLGQGFNSGDPGTSEVWDGKTTLNILVIGLDRRPDGGDQNADVIIIAQIDLINAKMRAVSIPRDLLVEIPGYGYDKVNSAYNHGIASDPSDTAAGVGLVRDTIEYNFGVPIDDYVLIDFSGFTDVVDAVGGITVDVPYDIYDPEYPTADYGTEEVYFPAGETQMDGEEALKYVRTRHADSDDQRRERQLQVLRAIFSEGKNLGSISKIDNIILALGDSAQTSFPLEEQLTLARLALEMDDADITLSSLAPPLISGGTLDSGAWVYSGDMTTISQFVQDAVNGTGDTAGG